MALMRITVVTPVVSKRRHASSRKAFTAATSSLLEGRTA